MPLVLVMQDILAEPRVQTRQPLGDRRHARFLCRIELRPVAHEAQVMALQQPQLIGREAEAVAPAIERVDPGEQAGIERDLHLMRGELWRVLPVDRLQCLVGRAGIEVVEDAADLIQEPAAALQRLDRVGEIRRLGRAGNRQNLGLLLGHPAIKGRREMLGQDALERRQLERRRPGFEERVVGHATLALGVTMPRDPSEVGCSDAPAVRLRACRTWRGRRRCAFR